MCTISLVITFVLGIVTAFITKIFRFLNVQTLTSGKIEVKNANGGKDSWDASTWTILRNLDGDFTLKKKSDAPGPDHRYYAKNEVLSSTGKLLWKLSI